MDKNLNETSNALRNGFAIFRTTINGQRAN